MTSPVRRLNDRGREAFRAWLENGATGTPPLALLDDPAMSDPLRLVIRRPRASFDSRYDLGIALVDLLDGLDVAEIQTDAGLWDWLSLCFIEQLCPPDEAGRRRPGQMDRYLLQLENHRTRYRHLVRTTTCACMALLPASCWRALCMYTAKPRSSWAPTRSRGRMDPLKISLTLSR
jgi:hypothetical protein